jgi:hypothetical protein
MVFIGVDASDPPRIPPPQFRVNHRRQSLFFIAVFAALTPSAQPESVVEILAFARRHISADLASP